MTSTGRLQPYKKKQKRSLHVLEVIKIAAGLLLQVALALV